MVELDAEPAIVSRVLGRLDFVCDQVEQLRPRSVRFMNVRLDLNT